MSDRSWMPLSGKVAVLVGRLISYYGLPRFPGF